MWLQSRHSPSSPAHLSPAPPLFVISQAWACRKQLSAAPSFGAGSISGRAWNAHQRGERELQFCFCRASSRGLQSPGRASITTKAAFPATTRALHPVHHPSCSPRALSRGNRSAQGDAQAGWEQPRARSPPSRASSGLAALGSPLPRRLHNLPLIPDTPGMRWCPMSKYLSTTQISCPGSLRREGMALSHGLGWPLSRGTQPLPELREQQRPPGALPESSSCLQSLDGESWDQPIPVCLVAGDNSVLLQEGRSEDPSFPGVVDHQQNPVYSCWKHWGTPSLASSGWAQESALSHNKTNDRKGVTNLMVTGTQPIPACAARST